MFLQQGRPMMNLVGLVVIGGPYGYWGRICILIIGNGDSDSNIALKVFDYPFDVEVGDGLPDFPGLEPAAFLLICHKSVFGQD